MNYLTAFQWGAITAVFLAVVGVWLGWLPGPSAEVLPILPVD